MKKKPPAAWKPVSVAVQVARHHKAVVAARKAASKPAASKATTAARSAAAKKAAATRAAKARKWTPDGDIALCSARAVAESLRLALGVPVSHDDVLALYWLVADDADAGASILATLEATRRWGHPACVAPSDTGAGLILGLDLPHGESHAVLAHDGIWWSWGEPHSPADFPGAVIDEAWAVTWQ